MADMAKHDALRVTQRIAAKAGELIASIDDSGSIVLHTQNGDIKLYVADGKMKVNRRGDECDACTKANLKFAQKLATAWNEELRRKARTTVVGNSIVQRPVCGGVHGQ